MICLATIVALVLAGGAAKTTASGAGPSAAATDRVLILADTVTGGTSSIEASEAIADGFAVDVVDATTWSMMTARQFASYRAIVLGDPTCSGLSAATTAAEANAKVWGPVINGNVVILGTDPVFHAGQGGTTVTQRGIDFAVNQVGKTGAYISLSCYYHGTSPGTPVPLLDGIGSGGFTVTGVGCYNNAHIVAVSPALAGLADSDISNWSCSVHEAFQNWPGGLIPLAIARDFDSSYTASDGSQGPPYILAGGDIKSFPMSLSPLDDTAAAGGSHTVTAQLLDGSTTLPVGGAKIGFTITAGPNAGASGTCAPATCLTDSAGHVAWTYHSNARIGSDTIEAFYDLNGNGVANVGEPQTTAGMTWTKAFRYVALGDSFSSGEGAIDSSGNPSFVSSTATSTDQCHRSANAYPELRRSGFSSFTFVACSGAVIGDFYAQIGNDGQYTEGAQLNALAPKGSFDASVTKVTLSLGGNDAGFPFVLDGCVNIPAFHHRGQGSCLKLLYEDLTAGVILLSHGGFIGVKHDGSWKYCDKADLPRCAKLVAQGNTAQQVANKIGYYPVSVPSLSGLYADIHSRAPNAKIEVLLYPHLFGDLLSGNCTVGQFHAIARTSSATLGATEISDLNGAADELDATISRQVQIARAAGVNIVAADPRAQFVGHRLCEQSLDDPLAGNVNANLWINGLLFPGPFIGSGQPYPWDFHPRAAGHQAFDSVLP